MKIVDIKPKPYIKLRIIATLIDYGIYFAFFYTYVTVFDQNPAPDVSGVDGILALPIFIMWFLYFVVVESFNGATPGHDICKLKVITTDGNKLTLGDAFKRRICDCVDILFYGLPAIICIIKTEKHQRIGDLFAGALVVKRSDIIETEIVF
ncbi:RDD family protein [Mucilaginibacter rubeus]|uniref:RDD family protein n=1 Tax=Mucilaginibacter rubeus TaxID=2027860 RepID=A0AAE6JP04_9SPHI|nr:MULTISPECIES: RDD family protein [Mucilaginibacter]QEM08055.1 RDD family protein [Mucilaginibacter rubeus]QEM20507.1 RDD family protein [Mucilaginibacter gossypii]QTE42768.1 RDD family protein [Mucilaginibacter rubeus]QTE49369.1 RDD family protein [Mucilaginibacter rubeus]QTE54465.1 RDD family protein [Mucilaginibacter rubeus]